MCKKRCEAPTTTCTTYQRKVNHFNMTYIQHESIYREDVKLFLHISNTNQNILIPIEKYINLV